MNMSWSAPQMSIRRRATQPFIFPHQRGRSQRCVLCIIDGMQLIYLSEALRCSVTTCRLVQARVRSNEKAPDGLLHGSEYRTRGMLGYVILIFHCVGQYRIRSLQHHRAAAQNVRRLSAEKSLETWYAPRRLRRSRPTHMPARANLMQHALMLRLLQSLPAPLLADHPLAPHPDHLVQPHRMFHPTRRVSPVLLGSRSASNSLNLKLSRQTRPICKIASPQL